MSREQAKQNLIAMGVAEPTEQQISTYLDQLNGETKTITERANKFKAEADKVAEYKKQIDEINTKGMTELEKANKEKEDAINQLNEITKANAKLTLRTKLADKGIVGENADKFLDSLSGTDGVDVEALAAIITEKETTAVNKKVKELAEGAGNPNGGLSGTAGKETEKTEAVKMAESVAARMSSNKANTDIINSYK